MLKRFHRDQRGWGIPKIVVTIVIITIIATPLVVPVVSAVSAVAGGVAAAQGSTLLIDEVNSMNR